MPQEEYIGEGTIGKVKDILETVVPRRILLITGKKSYESSGAKKSLDGFLHDIEVDHFSDFSVNPKLEDARKGLEYIKDFDLVIAVGGGSVLDMAKLINIFHTNKGDPFSYIKKEKEIQNRGKPFIAIPTTIGSGSEATHFAVVYVDNVKYSLAHQFMLPEYAIIDPNLVLSLPRNVAASSSMDAFSQAMESYWSVNATDESLAYSSEALKLAWENIVESTNNPTLETRFKMAKSAHLAGKAINIAKTTASHAVSYPVTTEFDVPHGHAVGLTLPNSLEFISRVTEKDCNIPGKNGPGIVRDRIRDICQILEAADPQEARAKIYARMEKIGLTTNIDELGITSEFIENIQNVVNAERLGNNPRLPTPDDLKALFTNR